MRGYLNWVGFFIVLLALASQQTAAAADRQTLAGTLVDVTCISRSTRDLGRLQSEHTRKCLLMPVCAQSGYALLTTHGEVFRFDSNGNELARKLIEKHSHERKWKVSVEGAPDENQLAVTRIKFLK